MRHPPAAGGPNQVGDCQAVPPGSRPDHAAHGGALSPAEAVAGSVIPGSADRGHRHHQPARQSRRERGLKTGAGDRVDPQGGHEDRPDGGCRVEQMGQRPLGIPGGDLLDSVDDDQTRRDKLVVQPVDRVLRKGHGQIAEKRSSVPHHRRRGLPGQGGMAVLHEPFRQEPGLSRSRRSHDDHRAIAAAAGRAIATHACSHDSKGMLHESLRPSRAGLCRGQRGGDDGRHWQRPNGERGLRAVHKNGVRLPRHSLPQQGSPKIRSACAGRKCLLAACQFRLQKFHGNQTTFWDTRHPHAARCRPAAVPPAAGRERTTDEPLENGGTTGK